MFAGEVNKLKEDKVKPKEQVTLEPYERDHAIVVGQYRYTLLLIVSCNQDAQSSNLLSASCYLLSVLSWRSFVYRYVKF